MLIKPGEVLQYMVNMSGADEGIATVLLESSTDGGWVWKQEYATDDSAISYTGTVASPLTTLVALGWIKNETPKKKLYRWKCTAYTSGTIPCTLINHIQPKYKFTDDVVVLVNYDAPASGTDGDGAQFAGKGSLYIDTESGYVYRNDGTSTMPIWSSLG